MSGQKYQAVLDDVRGGARVSHALKKHGVTSSAYYAWRKGFAGKELSASKPVGAVAAQVKVIIIQGDKRVVAEVVAETVKGLLQ